MRRLLAILFVALALAPGTWWRAPMPPRDLRQRIAITRLDPHTAKVGEAEVLGLWRIASRHPRFGSYSALAMLPGQRLFAVGDDGWSLTFTPPGLGSELGPHVSPGPVELVPFAGRRVRLKYLADIESITRDPATGRIWAGYEDANAIERFAPDFSSSRRVRPAAMRNWWSDVGPESLVRLADGRFLVISEGHDSWGENSNSTLLFPFDPVEGARPLAFHVAIPAPYRPVDAAQLPDRRVLILLRALHIGLPPRVTGAIMVADPRTIDPGRLWRGRVIARLDEPLPTDNFEGIALVPEPDGAVTIWLISDDNRNPYQRTLLLKLRWRPR